MIDPYEAQRERHLPDYMKSPDTRAYEREELRKADDAAWARHRQEMAEIGRAPTSTGAGTRSGHTSAPLDMGAMATAGASLCAFLVAGYGWLGLHWGIGQLIAAGAAAAVVGAIAGAALYVAFKVLAVVLKIVAVLAAIGILLHLLGVIDFMAVLGRLGRQLGVF